MKITSLLRIDLPMLSLTTAALCLVGCATTSQKEEASGKPATTGRFSEHYQTPDGRYISIGKSSGENGGWTFKEPHMEKCWIADNCTFTGYDVLYITPTMSTAKFNPDGVNTHELAKQNLVIEWKRELDSRGLFAKIVTAESDIPPGAHVLKVKNTITEYKKGGGGARYWVGLYGGGQPVLRVLGKMTDGDRIVFTYEARRSGVSAGARMLGAFERDEDIQLEDIRSMVLDLSDFMAAVAGRYTEKNN